MRCDDRRQSGMRMAVGRDDECETLAQSASQLVGQPVAHGCGPRAALAQRVRRVARAAEKSILCKVKGGPVPMRCPLGMCMGVGWARDL